MDWKKLTSYILLFVVFGSAHAEVMDKEPSLIQNISWGIASAIICLIAARIKPWLLLLAVPVPALYFIALIMEIRDPYVGPAILNEAGKIYIYSSYGSMVLFVVGVIFGLWWYSAAKQHNKSLKSGTPESGAP